MGADFSDAIIQQATSISETLAKARNAVPQLKDVNSLLRQIIKLSKETSAFGKKAKQMTMKHTFDFYKDIVVYTPDAIFRLIKDKDGRYEKSELLRELSFFERRAVQKYSSEFLRITEALSKIQMLGDKWEGRKLIPGELRNVLYSMILSAKRAYKETKPTHESKKAFDDSIITFLDKLTAELKSGLDSLEMQITSGTLRLDKKSAGAVSELNKLLSWRLKLERNRRWDDILGAFYFRIGSYIIWALLLFIIFLVISVIGFFMYTLQGVNVVVPLGTYALFGAIVSQVLSFVKLIYGFEWSKTRKGKRMSAIQSKYFGNG